VYIADDVVRAAIVGDSLQLVAQARTAVGVPMPEVAVAWTSNEPTKAAATAIGASEARAIPAMRTLMLLLVFMRDSTNTPGRLGAWSCDSPRRVAKSFRRQR
jgi:hypothetical protein